MKLTKLQELGNGRAKGVLPVSGGEGLPVWSLRGRQDGPTLVLTAGVHGCEYVGILLRHQVRHQEKHLRSGFAYRVPCLTI